VVLEVIVGEVVPCTLFFRLPSWAHLATCPLAGARLARAFDLIGFAKVSDSAAHARDMGFLRASDGISMNRERLLADGHTEAEEGCDVAVVNTCCVTHEAVSKSRKEAARAARTHRRVFVTGCGANLARTAFAGLPDNVVVVARRSEETPAYVAGAVGAIGCTQADARLDRVRAFVKVQDGCSFSCNFCVIPLVRGSSRSRRADAVLHEIERRVAQGHREVVLTGINLGCYRDREAGYDLPRLVRAAGATPGLEPLKDAPEQARDSGLAAPILSTARHWTPT